MPNIRERTDTALDIRPTEVGIEATAAAARRSGAFFNQAAGAYDATGHRIGSAIAAAGEVAVKYVDHQQISHGAKTLSETQLRLDQEWDDLKKHGGPNGGPIDPNDPSIAAKFREERVEPALEQFKSGFTTERSQQWAEHHVEQYRSHMVHKTTADMGSLAASAVHLDAVLTENNQATRAYNDPSALDDALSTYRGSIGGIVDSSPTIKAEVGAKVKSELMLKAEERIVKAAAMGAIAKGGDWQSITKKYPQYVNGAELRQFEQAERGYRRIEQAAQRSDRVSQEHEARLTFHSQVNELEAQTFPKNTGEAPTLPADYWQKVHALAATPGATLEPARIKDLYHHGVTITDKLNKPEPLSRVSHETTIDLLRRMRATDSSRLTSDNEIYDAFGPSEGHPNGKLTRADFDFLRKEYAQMRTPQGEALSKDRGEFFKRYAATIDPSFEDKPTALGSQKMYAAEIAAREQEEALRANGLNPHLVYDPRSEYFFGTPANIGKYRATLQDQADYRKQLKEDQSRKPNVNLTGPGKAIISIGEGPKVGERKQFKQGWGVWDGAKYVPEAQ